MIVTFISQCEKKAKNRTRRILDSFANRIGDNVWQTAITEQGLSTVKDLLRKTATKATAVSCHRNRTSRTTELVWIVGNRKKFNALGITPVNSTSNNIMHKEWENHWEELESIKLIATLAALLHDIGKSNKLFQDKLSKKDKPNQSDPYRHEWVSLHLFCWIIQDCKDDQAVFERLADLNHFLKNHNIKDYLKQKHSRFLDIKDSANLSQCPPLTKWIAWLIVTHHRLPSLPHSKYQYSPQPEAKKLTEETERIFKNIQALEGWVCSKTNSPQERIDTNWDFDALVLNSPEFQKNLKRYATKALNHPPFRNSDQASILNNPFKLNLSRLILMVADHNVSALSYADKHHAQDDLLKCKKLIANTDRKTHKANQFLDEHLIDVAQYVGKFSHVLPIIQSALPTLKDHDPLARNSKDSRFQWQDKAFKACRKQSQHSQSHGCFIVNMASTGCGKTIANARMAYALADPEKGSRFTIALGLRTLTLQTGASLRKDLNLTENQLATLVGGGYQTLFDLSANEESADDHGSESSQMLIDEHSIVDSTFDIDELEEASEQLKLGVITQSKKAKQLLYSPIVSCTIDHLMQASEHQRGGHYIVPTLRLLSSDLILDEPDDFSESDLPALSRLVHLAGLYGSRLILSSATLQEDQVQGLFTAYLEGRKIYNKFFNLESPKIPCLWVDENECLLKTFESAQDYHEAHKHFLQIRQKFLEKQAIHRIGEIIDIPKPQNDPKFYTNLAKNLVKSIQTYHQRHHFEADGKQISVGLVRMANIEPLIHLALSFYQLKDTNLDDTQIHLCTYHSRQVLALRNHLEAKLDQILNRKNNQHPAQHDAIKSAIKNCPKPQAKHHIFVLLASPVCEVGRDHDYDWAIVEPSSMRSLIQLSGRVWRHRPERTASEANIGIWRYNIKGLKGKRIAFERPGYEKQNYVLDSHDMETLIRPETLRRLDACPRILKPKSEDLNPKRYLSDLEHQVLGDLMNNKEKDTIVNAYWCETAFNRQHTHLIRLSPFREHKQHHDFVIDPNADEFKIYELAQFQEKGPENAKTSNYRISYYSEADWLKSQEIVPWLGVSLKDCLNDLNHLSKSIRYKLSVISIPAYQDDNQGYYFHEYLGCWKKP